jgi:O-antigen ligase
VAASLAVGFLMRGHHLFEERGRLDVWFNSMGYIEDRSNFWTGAGLGSFWVLGPSLNPGGQEIFTWMHSDWLQTLFEQGILGFLSVAILYVHALVRAKRNEALFVSLAGLGAFAIANMPLRFPLAGLYGAVLIQWAMAEREE